MPSVHICPISSFQSPGETRRAYHSSTCTSHDSGMFVRLLCQTVPRAAKKHRPQTVAAFREHERSDSEYESDDQTAHARTALSDIIDFGAVDIYTDQGWDTDLEQEGTLVNATYILVNS